MDTEELQKKQAKHDAEFWEHDASELERIRHVTLHAGKLLGKLSAYCEAQEHGEKVSTVKIKDDVIPDLMIYSLRLANFLGVDAEEQFLARLKTVREKKTAQNAKINS